jgi:hypothetical protein
MGFAFMSAEKARLIDFPLESFGDPEEIGLILSVRGTTKEHFTHFADADYVRMLMDAYRSGRVDGIKIENLWLMKMGWPEDWGIAE